MCLTVFILLPAVLHLILLLHHTKDNHLLGIILLLLIASFTDVTGADLQCQWV